MRVLVAEFVTAGGLPPEGTPPSLLREGRAMLDAAIEDLQSIPGIDVVIPPRRAGGVSPLLTSPTQAAPELPSAQRVGWALPTNEPPCNVDRVSRWAEPTRSPAASGFFADLARVVATCDAALVIAPELDDHLLRAHRTVTAAGTHWLGCSGDAIGLCGDKWRLYEHLIDVGIPTIPTQRAEQFDSMAWSPPWVVKPRDGAGSLGISTITTHADMRIDARTNHVVQPLVPGRVLSVALLVDGTGRANILPVAEQWLSDDGRLAYEGGRVPVDDRHGTIEELARRVLAVVPGLFGYIGIDVLVPDTDWERPIVVEINPRLTTSYLGYRALAAENLLRRLLEPTSTPIRWTPGRIVFDSDGTVGRKP